MTVHHGEDNPCDRWNNRKDTLLHSFRYCSAGYLVEKSRETFFKTKEKPAVFSASAGILSQQISFLEATDLPFEKKVGDNKVQKYFKDNRIAIKTEKPNDFQPIFVTKWRRYAASDKGLKI